MQITLGYSADQGTPAIWAKEKQVSTRNLVLESLTCVNKGASACWIQLFNLPFSPTGSRALDSTDEPATECGLTAHGFVFGDRAIVTGDDGNSGDKWVRPITADTFSLHESLAAAQSGESPNDLTAVVGANSSVVWQTTSTLEDGTTTVTAQEFPLEATPGILSLLGGRFSRGLYARAVTAADGATLIAAADVKFTSRYMVGPLTS